MANRIVTASVSGETIKLSNKLAGASGSHNAVSLAFTFDSAWDDTTKKVYFFDAYGKNPVYRLLTTDLLVDGAYIVPIPSEPLAHSGDMTIVVRGVEMDDDIIERIIMSANTTMKVAEATTPYNDVAPIEPTPTQAEQLLAAINSITGMTATATELSSGEPASVTKTTNLDGTINLEFGLPAGAKGDAATITVGTTTTGEPGTYASVTNVGTTSAAILNFTIPSGGFSPTITVTVDTGSTVTATSNGKTVSGTSVNGVCSLKIPAFGTWLVTATLGGISASKSILIDVVKDYAVELNYINVSTVLNNNSWSVISGKSSTGANYWAVGDRKAVTLNGTVGTQSINGTYYVFILGFNHNSSIEGTGIHFGGFKTALSGGKDICLVDSKYATSSTDGSKYFNMNHSSNTNTGGWKGCDIRYDILGSVDSKNTQNASSTTATNPVPNTLMAALPSDLRAVMKPMTKYSDNTGGGSDTASYVTPTIDYLPLLAEWEIFGARTYANSAEKNYQQQYTYFANGNSKVKYRHSDVSAASRWWERSVLSTSKNGFCYVDTSGGTMVDYANTSYGISPVFKV